MSYRYGIPVSELQRRIDSGDFAELMAEERIEPRGEQRKDYRAALVAWVIACSHRDPKKPAPRLESFMPRFDRPAIRKQTPEQMAAVMRHAAAAANQAFGAS